jgi:hypothetical protein
MVQRGKKLETKQIGEKFHVFQPINNTSTDVAQRKHIEAACESSMDLATRILQIPLL